LALNSLHWGGGLWGEGKKNALKVEVDRAKKGLRRGEKWW